MALAFDRTSALQKNPESTSDDDVDDDEVLGDAGEQWGAIEAAKHPRFGSCLRPILERQIAVRAEDSDDDDDPDRTYAFPPPVDLDAYAAACRLPPAEETEDEREARFQRERYYGL